VTGYELTRRPSWRSVAVPAVVGSFAVAACAAATPSATVVSAAGVVVLVVGAWRGRHGLVDAGGLVAFVGPVLAGLPGGSAGPVVVGATATVVAWDAAGNAVSLGRQVGQAADTTRVAVLHALASAAVGAAVVALAVVLFLAGPARQPVNTLFVLLLAGAVLVAALNRAPD